jgi:hypothetical protein
VSERVFYSGIKAAVNSRQGLRLYRRRRLALWRRPDRVFAPGEWQRVELHKDGRCYVYLWDTFNLAGMPVQRA